MLQIDIAPLLRARGIIRPYTWLMKQGFPESTVRKLVDGGFTSFSLPHLEKICLLLQCTPHDLMVWHPEASAPANAPLNILKPKPESGLEWVAGLDKLTVEELRELGRKLGREG